MRAFSTFGTEYLGQWFCGKCHRRAKRPGPDLAKPQIKKLPSGRYALVVGP
jgi:hypothetical protein